MSSGLIHSAFIKFTSLKGGKIYKKIVLHVKTIAPSTIENTFLPIRLLTKRMYRTGDHRTKEFNYQSIEYYKVENKSCRVWIKVPFLFSIFISLYSEELEKRRKRAVAKSTFP